MCSVVSERVKAVPVEERKGSDADVGGIAEDWEVDGGIVLSIGKVEEQAFDHEEDHERRGESRHVSRYFDNASKGELRQRRE